MEFGFISDLFGGGKKKKKKAAPAPVAPAVATVPGVSQKTLLYIGAGLAVLLVIVFALKK